MAPKDMKRIYLTSLKASSFYKELTFNPPEGYEFIALSPVRKAAGQGISKKPLSSLISESYKRVPVNLIMACLQKFERIGHNVDLIYSPGRLVFNKKPWVVDFEYAFLLIGFNGFNLKHFNKYKRVIERTLASEYCKRIICWTEASMKTTLWNLDCTGFEHKLDKVSLAASGSNYVKNYNRQKTKLLFVGSENLPGEFELKGGMEVLEAFVELRKKYVDLELVIRSDVPRKVRNRYAGIENLRIIDQVIPWQALEQEFKSADIFLFPSYNTPYKVFLDAMSYELPIISTDMWANPELVENNKTGFIIRKSDRVSYYGEKFILSSGIPRIQEAKTTEPKVVEEIFMYNLYNPEIQKVISKADPKVTEELVNKASILIENTDLRRRMGKAGRWEIEEGNFSIGRRNRILKRIFDEATA